MSNPTNHSLTGTWTATTTHTSCSPNALGDGYIGVNLSTYSWLSTPFSITNQSLYCNFGSAKTFDTIEVWMTEQAAGTRPKNYEVYVSDNGVDWGTAIASGVFSDSNGGKVITVASQTKQYFQVKCLDNYGSVNYIGFLGEIRVYVAQTDLMVAASFVTTVGVTGTIANLRDNALTTYTYASGVGAILMIDLGATYWIDSFLTILYYASTYVPREVYIWTSTDAFIWTCLGKISVTQPATNYSVKEVNFLTLINTRYVGLSVCREWASSPGYTIIAMLMCELRIYLPTSPGVFGITSLVAAGSGTADAGSISAGWSSYSPAIAYRAYIRAGSAPNAFGTDSAYFLGEYDVGETAVDIWTLADRTTKLVVGTQYYVILRAKFADGTEDTNTTVLNTTPNASDIDYPDVTNVTEDDTVNSVPGTYHECLITEVKNLIGFGGGGGTEKQGNLVSTDPGIANVRKDTVYTIESVSKTGVMRVGGHVVTVNP